jgi:hypothetical protein
VTLIRPRCGLLDLLRIALDRGGVEDEESGWRCLQRLKSDMQLASRKIP